MNITQNSATLAGAGQRANNATASLSEAAQNTFHFTEVALQHIKLNMKSIKAISQNDRDRKVL
jgi:hypothetical protein